MVEEKSTYVNVIELIYLNSSYKNYIFYFIIYNFINNHNLFIHNYNFNFYKYNFYIF